MLRIQHREALQALSEIHTTDGTTRINMNSKAKSISFLEENNFAQKNGQFTSIAGLQAK